MAKLFQKLGDLLRANILDLLNKAEDPEKTFNLLLEDATEHRGKIVASIAEVMTARNKMRSDLAGAESSLTAANQRAKRYVEQGKNDLAEAAMKQVIALESQKKTLAEAVSTHNQKIEELKASLRAFDAKMDNIRAMGDTLKARMSTARAKKLLARVPTAKGPDLDSVIGRLEDVVETTEAEAQAVDELAAEGLGTPASAEERFQQDDLDAEVERRLAALKAEGQK